MLLERSSARAPGRPTKRRPRGRVLEARERPLAAVARPRRRRAAPDLRRAFDLATAAVGVGPAPRPGGAPDTQPRRRYRDARPWPPPQKRPQPRRRHTACLSAVFTLRRYFRRRGHAGKICRQSQQDSHKAIQIKNSSAYQGARRTNAAAVTGFRGIRRPHPSHGRVRRRARRQESSTRPARLVGRSRGVPRASTAEPESPPESAAHERAAKGPLHLPFQPRGAHAALRVFLGTSPKTPSRARFFFSRD